MSAMITLCTRARSRSALSRLVVVVCVNVAPLLLVAGCSDLKPWGTPPPPQRESAGLVRCTLLIPMRHNDGTPVDRVELDRIESRLLEAFGGYTVAGTVRGAYRMADGTTARDVSLALWVAVPPARVGELRREAAGIARELRQESIYFERGGGAVEFVGSD